MPEITVTVYPSSTAPHVSQIYTGLHELHHAGRIRLDYSASSMAMLPPLHKNLLCARVARDGSPPRLVCFDMRDGGRTIPEDVLRISDVYFKRSYDPEFASRLSPELAVKLLPYGLNYACRSQYLRRPLKQAVLYERISRSISPRAISAPLIISGRVAKSVLASRFPMKSMPLQLAGDFEVPPDQPCERRILFLTRAWAPTKDTPEVTSTFEELNELRAETIRLLRQGFGDRFIGGFKRTPYAERRYPDVIATHRTDKAGYLATVKRCLVAVTTTGLHDSIGWKLPEYLAASRCIVTEPLVFGLPRPLVEGRNILTFRTPGQCVEACGRLLDDPALADEMRRENFAYYRSEVEPSALLLNRLREVVQTEAAIPA